LVLSFFFPSLHLSHNCKKIALQKRFVLIEEHKEEEKKCWRLTY